MNKISALLLLAFSLYAFEFDRNSILSPQGKSLVRNSGGLLDASRFTVSHQYSMTFSSSSSGQQDWDGLYLSTLQYRFSVPLTLMLDMGMAHQPGALFNAGPIDRTQAANSFVLPRVELRYQPFKNTLIRLEYFDMGTKSARDNYYPDYLGMDNPLFVPSRKIRQ